MHENCNKKTLKGVSKVVVKNEIHHENYVKVLQTNKSESRTVTSIRSFKRQVYTLKQSKTALASFYDKFDMFDSINCVPFGYVETTMRQVVANQLV